MSRRYSLITIWYLDEAIERVWDAIIHVEHWPAWWPSVVSVVQLEPGSPDGLGTVQRFTWQGRLPYTLTFDMRVAEVVQHHRLVGIVTGELRGVGTCTLQALPGGTRVRYDWNVATTKAWMNALAPLLEPAFRWNHDYVMQLGGQCLAQRLQCRLRTGEDLSQNPAGDG